MDGNDNYYSLLSDLIHCHRTTRSIKCARSGEGKYTPATTTNLFTNAISIFMYCYIAVLSKMLKYVLCEFFLRTIPFGAFSLTSLTLRARNGFM